MQLHLQLVTAVQPGKGVPASDTGTPDLQIDQLKLFDVQFDKAGGGQAVDVDPQSLTSVPLETQVEPFESAQTQVEIVELGAELAPIVPSSAGQEFSPVAALGVSDTVAEKALNPDASNVTNLLPKAVSPANNTSFDVQAETPQDEGDVPTATLRLLAIDPVRTPPPSVDMLQEDQVPRLPQLVGTPDSAKVDTSIEGETSATLENGKDEESANRIGAVVPETDIQIKTSSVAPSTQDTASQPVSLPANTQAFVPPVSRLDTASKGMPSSKLAPETPVNSTAATTVQSLPGNMVTRSNVDAFVSGDQPEKPKTERALKSERLLERDRSLPPLSSANMASVASAPVSISSVQPSASLPAFVGGTPPSQDTALDVGDFAPNSVARELDEVLKTNTSDRPRAEPALARSIITQMMHVVSRSQAEGVIELRLQPEELGRVRLTMVSGEAGFNVQIMAERPDTLDLIRRNIDMLENDLREQGFSDMSFSFGGDSSSDTEGFDGDDAPNSPPNNYRENTSLVVDVATPAPSIHNGTLDIRV